MEAEASARQVIRAAIAAAGGGPKIAETFGMSAGGISAWATSGRVPAERITALCSMGGNVVKPQQILDAMARESVAKAAA